MKTGEEEHEAKISMGYRFRKTVQLFPGVRLNFSRSGISTTIGIPGAGLTIGARGAYANLGLSGTGAVLPRPPTTVARGKFYGSEHDGSHLTGAPISRR